MSTGASREAPVDNECLGKYELFAFWWALLSTGASREAPVDIQCPSWALLSTDASREAPVDIQCLGNSKQVGGSGHTWNMSYWQLG